MYIKYVHTSVTLYKGKYSVVHCKLCGKHVKFCGNTTNLCVHLRDTHSKVYSDLLQAEKEKIAASKVRMWGTTAAYPCSSI